MGLLMMVVLGVVGFVAGGAVGGLIPKAIGGLIGALGGFALGEHLAERIDDAQAERHQAAERKARASRIEALAAGYRERGHADATELATVLVELRDPDALAQPVIDGLLDLEQLRKLVAFPEKRWKAALPSFVAGERSFDLLFAITEIRPYDGMSVSDVELMALGAPGAKKTTQLKSKTKQTWTWYDKYGGRKKVKMKMVFEDGLLVGCTINDELNDEQREWAGILAGL